jgi:serine/threonine protein kinase
VYPNATQNTNAHFKVIRHLNDGSYGEVSAVQEPTTQKEYVQKLIRVRDRRDLRARDRIEEQVKTEVEVGQKLNHHHITSVLFYVRDPLAFTFNLIMLPVGDYDLRRFLEDKCVQADYPRQELKHLDQWFGCLVSALAFAHAQSIKHEDIKPSNIIIKDYRPYLADFGSAKDFAGMENSVTPDLMSGSRTLVARAQVLLSNAIGSYLDEWLRVMQTAT